MQADHEAFQLAVRKQLCAGGTSRVLRSDHDERGLGRISDPIYGDAVFFHDFEQGRLGAAGGAVDLISEEDVAEDGAGMQLRFTAVMVDGHEADDIAGQHVDGKLHATGLQRHCRREGAGHRRLAYARNVFEQDMSSGQDGRQYFFQLVNPCIFL